MKIHYPLMLSEKLKLNSNYENDENSIIQRKGQPIAQNV